MSLVAEELGTSIISDLSSLRVHLPKGQIVNVKYNEIMGSERYSIQEDYDITGLKSFPVTIETLGDLLNDKNEILRWRSPFKAQNTCPSKGMQAVEAIRIIFKADGCTLEYKFLK